MSGEHCKMAKTAKHTFKTQEDSAFFREKSDMALAGGDCKTALFYAQKALFYDLGQSEQPQADTALDYMIFAQIFRHRGNTSKVISAYKKAML